MDDMRWENLKKSFRELTWYEYLMGVIMIVIAARAMVLGFTTGSAGFSTGAGGSATSFGASVGVDVAVGSAGVVTSPDAVGAALVGVEVALLLVLSLPQPTSAAARARTSSRERSFFMMIPSFRDENAILFRYILTVKNAIKTTVLSGGNPAGNRPIRNRKYDSAWKAEAGPAGSSDPSHRRIRGLDAGGCCRVLCGVICAPIVARANAEVNKDSGFSACF